MKRGVVVALVLAAAIIIYRHHASAPERHYRAFAEEIAHRRFDKAAAMCDGLTPDDLAKGGLDPAMLQTLFPSRFQINERDTSADGAVTLRAEQTLLFNPPGVESATRPAMAARMNQTVTLREGDDGWKVVAFENRLVSMTALASR